MPTLETINSTLSTVYKKYDNIKLGVAGSYVNGTATENSDIDIVIDGDSVHGEIADYVKSLFNIPVDVLWLDLLKKDDKEMDHFAVQNGLMPNKFSAYKTIIKEVQWL